MEILRQKFYNKYALTQVQTKRNFINTIDWNERVIGIKGSRGVGKTTLILQYIKDNYKPNNKVLYVSLDDMYFANNSFYQLADSFHKKGGELLALDEVHRYPNWSLELKNIYDDMPSLKIIFTGSSLLHIHKAKADISRRAVIYNMPGLSFREFLEFETNQKFPIYSLSEIIDNHIEIAINLKKFIKPLSYFEDYLNYGYYPYYLENRNTIHQKLNEIILTILEVDIPQFSNIQSSNIIYLKKLLKIISNSVPFKPNMNSLSQRTGISLNTLKTYIKLLYDAKLISLLYPENKSINSLNRPEKIYLQNSNLMYNLVGNSVNIGNIRETFLSNQITTIYEVNASKVADFIVDKKYTLEVGGKGKRKKEIKGISNSYIVMDDIEIGSDNTIPLWMLGFLY